MAIGLVGRKCGMTRVFTEAGESIPVTVIEVLPNRITQIKSSDRDGYRAVQVTYGARRPQLVSKAAAGHYAKAGVAPGKALLEFRLREIEGVEIITPAATHARGAQLSLYFPKNARTRYESMLAAGLACDYRAPGIVRLAPAPLFNTFDEVWRAAEIVRATV